MEGFFSDASLELGVFLLLKCSIRELLRDYFSTFLHGEKKSSLEFLNWSIHIIFSSIYSLGSLWNQDSKSKVKNLASIPFLVARLFQELKLVYLKEIKSPLKHCMCLYRADMSLKFSFLLWHFCRDRPKSANCYKNTCGFSSQSHK